MSTDSTKSRNRKTTAEQSAAPASSGINVTGNETPEISPLVWWIASLTILVVAAFIRFYKLGLVPMHHDEGVNGFFLTNLYRTGVYHYDPSNYHGPTLYYFALLIAKINGLLFGKVAGLSTVGVRLVPALFGTGTVCLILCLRRDIGAIAALTAAAFIALSPGDVYISRYFIHETQFVFFTLGIVVAALRYYESADPLYLLLAALSAALLFATKETAIVSVIVLGLALAIASLYMRYFNRKEIVAWEKKSTKRRQSKKKGGRQAAAHRERLARFGGLSNVLLWSSVALFIFIFVNIIFYSSFFTYAEGVNGALQSLQVWVKTGTNENPHLHSFGTYLVWLWQEQSPLLLLGVMGAVIALIARRSRFAIFVGAWAFGLIAAYSLIPYKTPWLMINFTVPLAIISGYAVNEIYKFEGNWRSRVVALAITLAALAVSTTQTVILNFYHYDDDKYAYVYAHTYRDLLAMMNQIDRLSLRAGTNTQTPIAIVAPEYWPLPWYLRDFEGAAFWAKLADNNNQPLNLDVPIVVCSEDQETNQSLELQMALGNRYQRINAYRLRPGVTLVLYAKKELVTR